MAAEIAEQLTRTELGEFKVFERATPALPTRKRSTATDLAAGSLAGMYLAAAALALHRNHRGPRGAHDHVDRD